MTTTATYGPNGQAVAALLDRIRRMTPDEIAAVGGRGPDEWGVAWRAVRDVVRDSGRIAAWDAARDDVATAAGAATWEAVDAVEALVVADLITPEHYRTLTDPLASVIGDEWFKVPA